MRLRTRALAGLTAAGLIGLAPSAQATPADTTRIAVIGDSITTGYGVYPWQSWAFRFEARQSGDNILPLGVNGATTRRWLQQYLPQLDQLTTWRPTTVMVALGANEYHMTRPAGEYADHLRQLAEYLHAVVPHARIVFLHYYRILAEFEPGGCDALPNDPVQCIHANPPDTWDEYGTAMRLTAGNVGATYLDVSHTRYWAPLISADQAHLTAEGHRVYELDVHAALTSAP